MSRFAILISLFLVASAACGGDDDDSAAPDARPGTDAATPVADAAVTDAPVADAAPTSDAAPPADAAIEPDAPPQLCVVPAAGYGAVGDLAITAAQIDNGPPGEPQIFIFGDPIALNTDASPDRLRIELYQGYGVFTKAIAPGTYQLTGAETNYADCGACVLIDGDVDADGNSTGRWMPTGGSITLTSIEGTLTGTLNDVTFQHLDLSTGEPLDDGCTTSITSAAFTGPITIIGGGGGGEVDAGI